MKKTKIGEKIEQYVNYLGYTDKELEKFLNFNSLKMLSIYKNEYIPNEDEIIKFSKLFNTNKEDLMNGISINELLMNEEFINRQKTISNNDKLELIKFNNYLKNK